MKTATLRQAKKVLGLLEDVPAGQLQKLFSSGLLNDLLTANIDQINREEFRTICGFKPLGDFKITTASFDSEKCIGENWRIIIEEQDRKSATLAEVDFGEDVEFLHFLSDENGAITEEEKFKRQNCVGRIRYGSTVFAGLWNDYLNKGENSVLERLYRCGAIRDHFGFFGDIICDPGGSQRVLSLHRYGDYLGEGRWQVCLFGVYYNCLSIVSPQISS